MECAFSSITALLFLSSCGTSVKDNNAQLNDKKAALEKLKADKTGQFTYQDTPSRVKTTGQQGQAIVNVANDAQVRKALSLLGVVATK